MLHATDDIPDPVPPDFDDTATFGAVHTSAARVTPPQPLDHTAIARSEDFRDLRRRLRTFAFPMSALFLTWYLMYVVAAAYLPDLMAVRLVGEINVGLVMGLGQFASTILITVLYMKFAARHLDPRVEHIRRNAGEGEVKA